MRMIPAFCTSLVLALLICMSASIALAQITPSDDSYTLTSSPTVNFGAKNTLEVESAGATTFVRFDLSGIPTTVTGSMVAKATLKVYVSSVATAGSFNVDLVTSPWTESTITANNSPTLGSAIASAVPVTKDDKNQYVLVDVTAAAVDWLNGTANDGIAIVPDGTVSFALNSKETTTTSHPPELDIVLTGPPGPAGSITGVTAGVGLAGGGTKGNVTLSLLTTCASGQVLQWNGSTWACSAAGTGTITGVTAGTDLMGGGTGGTITLNLDTTKVPQLTSNNVFSGNQTFSGNAGIGAAASTNSYTPLTVGTANSFGTWLAIANSSSGGHTWNIISAGSGNAEGAGNIGITDLTGKSTIWLEGNTNTSNLTASASAGGAIIDADVFGKNNGAFTPGLRFGGSASGEGIISNRVGGIDAFGLQLFTEFTPRLSILQNGQVGIGTTNTPAGQLQVNASSYVPAIQAQGFSGSAGSNGTSGVEAYGGNGDPNTGSGGDGIYAQGGQGAYLSGGDGPGGYFQGGGTYNGVYNGGDGIYAVGGSGIAGYFGGEVFVNGNLIKAGGSFKIDHPLDPANKYLSHSFVESPDMMNVYNGVAILDANGEAVIQMPEWFGSLNRDFRYQLTCIGGFAPVYIAEELANNQFKIGGGRNGIKISWQITGVRQDAWANAHRIPVEEMKSDRERGFYLAPELFGAPAEKSIAWARHPETMKRMREMREKQSLPHAATARKSGPAVPTTRSAAKGGTASWRGSSACKE